MQVSKTIADIATLFFCTSLFAASLSFHNAVARYFFALGRAGVLPTAFARTNRQGAPFIGSLTQSLIAVVIIFVFWQSDNDPVLQLFTWLTNLGGPGGDPAAQLALASFSVVGYFRKIPRPRAWPFSVVGLRSSAPARSGAFGDGVDVDDLRKIPSTRRRRGRR